MCIKVIWGLHKRKFQLNIFSLSKQEECILCIFLPSIFSSKNIFAYVTRSLQENSPSLKLWLYNRICVADNPLLSTLPSLECAFVPTLSPHCHNGYSISSKKKRGKKEAVTLRKKNLSRKFWAGFWSHDKGQRSVKWPSLSIRKLWWVF